MSSKLGLKALAGAIALTIAGAASANTTTGLGEIFLNVVDTSKGLDFFFDTGLNLSTFNPNGGSGITYTSNSLAGDANYQALLTAAGGDSLSFGVAAAINTASPNARQAYFTGLSAPGANKVGSAIATAENAVELFLGATNAVASSTTNSAFSSGSGNASFWPGTGGSSIDSKLTVVDLNDVGSSSGFYSYLTNAPASNSTHGTAATYAGTWKFASDTLTYTLATPIPTPLLLLLSGLGLMGVIARRGKSVSGEAMINASAA